MAHYCTRRFEIGGGFLTAGDRFPAAKYAPEIVARLVRVGWVYDEATPDDKKTYSQRKRGRPKKAARAKAKVG